MKVNNGKCILRLSFRTLKAAKKRNIIAILAIALTTLMFTTLFTVIMSINSSYVYNQLRQVGCYAHGEFKGVTIEQSEKLARHSLVREYGKRTMIGLIEEEKFAKLHTEISYMDDNYMKWGYSEPTVGRKPEKGNEVAVDTGIFEALGIEPKVGAEITLTYEVYSWASEDMVTDTFIVVGYWEHDKLSPGHFVNVSKEYLEKFVGDYCDGDIELLYSSLEIMFANKYDIEGKLEKVAADSGYDCVVQEADNYIETGINWAYTESGFFADMDMESAVAIVMFLLLVIFTGYMIIYNIFQISVGGDIRFYGLLKTLGVTPSQLKRIIKFQALFLCIIGVPAGMLMGYAIGAVILPMLLNVTILGADSYSLSISPLIFIASALFSIFTVLISCNKPGKIASKVSPVEATKYTDATSYRKKSSKSRSAKIWKMALANIGRNKSKTVLVIVSLSLSIILLNVLVNFVTGFDLDKYVSSNSDFIVGTSDYFAYNQHGMKLTDKEIKEIQANTETSESGIAYMAEKRMVAWVSEEYFNEIGGHIDDMEIAGLKYHENMYSITVIAEVVDEYFANKMNVIEGSIEHLFDENANNIVMLADEYQSDLPKVGDKIVISYEPNIIYTDETVFFESSDGELIEVNGENEFYDGYQKCLTDVEYTVCAIADMPYELGMRFSIVGGYMVIMPETAFGEDYAGGLEPMIYAFDTTSAEAEAAAEEYLKDMTSKSSYLMYESKATKRAEFEQFKYMFTVVGTILCGVIGLIGVLNYINAIITSVIARKKEFAVLRAVGMTVRQLEKMMIYEGLCYSVGTIVVTMAGMLLIGILISNALVEMFWFYEYSFSLIPVAIAIPLFIGIGAVVPKVAFASVRKQSIVSQL